MHLTVGVLLAVGGWLGERWSRGDGPSAGPLAQRWQGELVPLEREGSPRPTGLGDGAASPAADGGAGGAAVGGGVRRIDRRAWDELAGVLRAHRGARTAEASPPVPAAATPPVSASLPREYVEEALRAVKPLVAECYELALADAPDLEGRLLVELTVVGEADVGGIVEDSAVSARSELRHPLLEECVRETMYTVALPAPSGGGVVRITYPFRFARARPSEQASPQPRPQPQR